MIWLGVVEKNVISANVDKRPFGDIGVALVVDDRRQVGFCPEGTESGLFEPLPEVQEVWEADLASVDLELELAEW